jgi:hypothetical protein
MFAKACTVAGLVLAIGVGCSDDSGTTIADSGGGKKDSGVDSKVVDDSSTPDSMKPDTVGPRKDLGDDGPRPDGPIVTPDGPIVTPDGPIVTPDGPIVTPDGPIVTPDGPIVTPDGPIVTPDGPIVTPDGPIVTPDGPIVTPDGPIVTPDGPIVTPDGPIVTPDGPIVTPDGPIVTPDGPIVTPDGPVGDGPVVPCNAALIGKHCTDDNQCTGGFCLQTYDTGTAAGGVCSCSCTVDNLSTTTNEDDCPGQPANVCGEIDVQGGQTMGVCFKKCTPRDGANDCDGPISCDPFSIANINNLFTGAVCSNLGCSADADCQYSINETCNLQTKPNCLTAGATCQQLAQGSNDGRCTVAGVCDSATKLCGSRSSKTGSFNQNAQVGSTCTVDADCGPTAVCFSERTSGSQTRYRNGYCVIPGCAHSGLSFSACPSGSACNTLYTAGACQKTCDPTQANTCRGNSADRFGDYECYRWDNITFFGTQVAANPVCDWGLLTCAFADQFFGTPAGVGCTVLGLVQGNPPTNPSNMRCRNINTGADTTPSDSAGYCLDDTASGQ